MDQAARTIESLWTGCADRVRRYLMRFLGDSEAANDLLGQTFLEAARQWDRYRGKGSREAWLFGIARNQARLHQRWWERRRETPLDEAIEQPTPPAEVESNEEEARMWNAIQELPPLYRQTLLLRLADELSYEEIAAALDVPLGTVRSRVHEAVRRLRTQLNPSGKEDRHDPA